MKFKPEDYGFSYNKNEELYYFIKNGKVLYILNHVNYWMGLQYEYTIKHVIHCINGSTKNVDVFKGKIPTNEFAKELFKNILITKT